MYLLFAESTPWYEWVFSGAGPWIIGLVFTSVVSLIGWKGRKKKKAQQLKEKEETARKTNEALELKKTELRIQVMPELCINGTLINTIERLIQFDLNNNGNTAQLISVTVLTGNLKQHSTPFPHFLNKGEMLYLYFIYTGKGDINNDKFAIELYFKDKLNNTYKSLISGKGSFQVKSTDFIEG